MRSYLNLLSTAALLVCAIGVPAAADDHEVVLGAGGLVPQKSTTISMESEDLEISVRGITVKYVFRNNGDRDVDAIVAFPLPELDGSQVYNEPVELPFKDQLNFVGFEVFVQDQEISPRLEVRAFRDGKEISARLHSEGLPLSVIDPGLAKAVSQLPEARLAALEKDGLVQFNDWSDSLNGPWHRDYWGDWQTRLRFYWTQHFRAGKTVEVRHEYKPVVGGGYLVDNGYADDLKEYCLTDDEQLRLVKDMVRKDPERYKKEGSDTVFWEKEIEFILTTAKYWSGPIGTFHLTVVADSPEDIVRTCMQGLKRSGPTRYELTLENFRPDSDLKLLILQPNK